MSPSQHLARVHHPVRIERGLDLAHHRKGGRILPAGEQAALELTDAMLGRIGAAEASDDSVNDLVHRIPAVEKSLPVCADRLRDIEMDVAVAEMAEGDHPCAGRES